MIIALFALIGFSFTSCGDELDDNNSVTHTHSFGNWIDITAATCTTAKVQERSCFCGAKETQSAGEALGHDWTDWEGDNPPTCTEPSSGYVARECKREKCGKTEQYSEPVPALGHDFGNWTQTKAPTVSEDGEETGICQRYGCTETGKKAIPATGTKGLNFSLTDDGKGYSVSKGDVTDSVIIIPASHNGLPVTSIGEEAFQDCLSLECATFAAGSQLKTIGSGAFVNTSLIGIIIPASVTDIGNYAFYKCKSLKSVTFEGGGQINRIGNGVFNETGITSITIPESVITIGTWAFTDSSLTSVSIPASVTTISEGAFGNCQSLASVTFAAGSKLKIIGKHAFNKTIFTNITIPASVIEIGEYAFSSCENLTSIGISAGVTVIGEGAFDRCANLENITIPASITSIGKGAFAFCKSISGITFAAGSKLESIVRLTFEFCENLTSIEIPASVTSIGNFAFVDCKNLASVIFAAGSKLESIGEFLFLRCENLTSIEIPANVTSIGNEAFAWSEETLTSITFASGSQLKTIGEKAFGNAGITNITIPPNVTSIGDDAFIWCNNLTSVYFQGIVTNLSYSAFNGLGDLCIKYLAVGGGPGKYTREEWGEVWTKQSGSNGNISNEPKTIVVTGIVNPVNTKTTAQIDINAGDHSNQQGQGCVAMGNSSIVNQTLSVHLYHFTLDGGISGARWSGNGEWCIRLQFRNNADNYQYDYIWKNWQKYDIRDTVTTLNFSDFVLVWEGSI